MFNIQHITVRRLVTVSAVSTLVAVGLMVMGIVFPRPLLLVLAMSLGQLFGTLSLALYLLAIVLDLQGLGSEDRGALGDGAAGLIERGARPVWIKTS